MALNAPPPYVNITGISRAVMKDNAQENITNYNGNARPGELVVNLEVDPPTVFIGNNAGQLTQLVSGSGGDYGNANVVTLLSAFGSNTISTTGNITATRLQNNSNLEIRSNVAGTIKNWTFDTLGDFNMPVGGNISGSGLITADRVSATGNVTGGNLISTNGVYANIDFVVGDQADASATKSRFVTDPGFSYIQTGNGTVGSTGNIVFSPYSDPTQRVVIDTSTGNVTATGNISGGNILGNGASMTSVATQVADSWNVTTGTDNYSFTVPENGVYQLWLRGNIPNGIITYIATVSVTNSNVPVLGQQFAWNYTDAGSPLLITAIPDQIVGTAGAISNALPAVGTTSNTFVFGINNSSGVNVTVNYGYTKLS